MAQACPATVGQPLDEIETPALLVDLDAYERNLKRMAGAIEGQTVRLRPHAKTHKSPEIALQQMAHGAVGVCCQKVGEAEVLVAGGVPDVLVSNQVVGTIYLLYINNLKSRRLSYTRHIHKRGQFPSPKRLPGRLRRHLLGLRPRRPQHDRN